MFTVTLKTENASVLLLIFHLTISVLLCWGKSNPSHKQSQSSPKKPISSWPRAAPLELKPKIISKEIVGVVVGV